MEADRDDKELHPEPVARHAGPIITGHVVRLTDGYSREIKVGQPVLVAVMLGAAVARMVVAMIATVLRAGGGAGGATRSWKELRKGPEFLVTPLRVRNDDGLLCEVEIHGHLPQSALHRHDYVQITARRHKDTWTADRAERIVNLTTGQLLTPRVPTVWSHLGPALLVQSLLGLAVLGTVATCAVVR